MDSDLTPEQRAQLDNRDAKGKFKSKAHSGADVDADVLGLDSPAPAAEDERKATFTMTLTSVHSQAPGSAAAALESDSALVRLAARSGWDLDDRQSAQRSPEESRIEAALTP